jgi:hypothetical protein
MDMRRTGREKDSVSGHAEGCVEAAAKEVIAVIFTGDNAYRDHVYRRVMNERTFGATAGDSFWMGYGDYDEVDPFARYREPEKSKSITVPAWRERIEKAKRDISRHQREIASAEIEWSVSEFHDLLSIARGFDE